MLDNEIFNQGKDSSGIEIDPDDLIIINDNNNWKPPKELILAYANQLGFDINNDPPELLSIAEKYLTKDIPDHIRRAFSKDGFTLVYINVITKEVELDTEFEELAREEYKEAKEKLLKEMREKEKEANKIIVMPRGKIAPIGAKKALEDPMKKREKEFMKEIKKSFKETEKKNEFQDEETRQLKETLKKEEKIKGNIFDNNNNNNNRNKNDDIEDKYKYSDDDVGLIDESSDNNNKEDRDNGDSDYDKKHEINSKERKFPNKNKIKNNGPFIKHGKYI